MTIQYLPGAYDADGCGTRHSIVIGPSAEQDPATDLHAAFVASLGLEHVVRAVMAALDDLDGRVGALAERINAVGLPPRVVEDGAEQTYFGLYSLLPEQVRSAPEHYGAAEAG